MALLAIGKPDGCADLGAGQVLEALEMDLRLRLVAGALQGGGSNELRRGVHGIDFEGLVQGFDGLVVLLHLQVAVALKVVGIGVHGVEF